MAITATVFCVLGDIPTAFQKPEDIQCWFIVTNMSCNFVVIKDCGAKVSNSISLTMLYFIIVRKQMSLKGLDLVFSIIIVPIIIM